MANNSEFGCRWSLLLSGGLSPMEVSSWCVDSEELNSPNLPDIQVARAGGPLG
jgi:hypothetical protein